MPFKSQAERGWMWANKPEMARRWEAETPNDAALPARVGKKPDHIAGIKQSLMKRRMAQ